MKTDWGAYHTTSILQKNFPLFSDLLVLVLQKKYLLLGSLRIKHGYNNFIMVS